jgi:hypothetical protein
VTPKSRKNIEASAPIINFHTLPVDVFSIIKTYFSSLRSYAEYRNLLNTNKAIFSVIKKETVITMLFANKKT